MANALFIFKLANIFTLIDYSLKSVFCQHFSHSASHGSNILGFSQFCWRKSFSETDRFVTGSRHHSSFLITLHSQTEERMIVISNCLQKGNVKSLQDSPCKGSPVLKTVTTVLLFYYSLSLQNCSLPCVPSPSYPLSAKKRKKERNEETVENISAMAKNTLREMFCGRYCQGPPGAVLSAIYNHAPQ